MLGAQNFWTTPEAVGVDQPLSSAEPACHIVFDGRVDNREEIFALLRAQEKPRPGISDAELVLYLYLAQGSHCAAALKGAYAFAIYDEGRHQLLCARDPAGERTLFYSYKEATLVVASEEQALLAHPLVGRDLNPQRFARFLTFKGPVASETFFADIAQLLPGHTLICDRNGLSVVAHWTFAPSRRYAGLRYPQLVETFRDLLDQSVNRRLRARSVPAAMLSGGLDSTPAAVLAARRLQAKGQTLSVFSWCFDDFPEADERTFIQSAQRVMACDPHWVPSDQCWDLLPPDTPFHNPNTPELNLFRNLKQTLYQSVAENGQQVLLSGAYGDVFYTGMDRWLLSLLKHQGAGAVLATINRLGLGKTSIEFGKELARLSGLRRPVKTPAERYPWLSRQAMELLGDVDEFTIATAETGPRPRQVEQVLGLRESQWQVESYYADQAGIDVRDPYRDMDLIDFMLAVPDCCLYGRNGYKQICRDAMVGILPEDIRLRARSADLSAIAVKGLTPLLLRHQKTLLAEPGDMVANLVDLDWIRQLTPEDLADGEKALAFWHTFLIHRWLLESQA